MANQWLTGAGTPSTGIGQVTDYYRDTVSNLVYYRENAFTWVVVPAFTPSPDGIGTTWLHGATAPLTAQGSDGDYFYEDTHKIVYRKEGATWVAKGSLDFIGIYGVQWGNGLGAPVSSVPLNALPAGSFYLDVDTSDIYFKPPSMVWELKGQLGGGGGGSSVTVENVLTSNSTVNALSAAQGKVLNDALVLKAPLVSPALTGVPTAPLAAPNTNTTQVATTSFVHQEINAVTPSSIGAENSTNKATSLDSPDDTKYPTTQAVAAALGDYEPTLPANVDSVKFLREDRTFQSILDVVATGISFASAAAVVATDSILVALGKLQKQVTDLAASALSSATLRYSVNAQTDPTYTVVSGDVNAAGSVIVTCTNAASITVTFPTPATLGATTGDSVNIRQGEAGVVTLSGALTGNLVFSAIHDTRTVIATSGTTWMVVGG